MVADFGFQGFPARPEGIDRMTHYRTVLETAPPEFSTVWISDHLQFGHDPTPADVIREVERLVDVGVSHFQVSFDEMPTYRRFIDEVLPVVRLERHPQPLA